MKTISVVLALVFSLSWMYGQNSALVGHWEGTITREGKGWAVRLDLGSHAESLSGTADVPDYGLYAMPFKEIRLEGSAVDLLLIDRSDTARFNGNLNGDKISGQWSGIGVTASFEVRKTQQNPETVMEEDVRFQNGDALLIGTLVKPRSDGRHPAVVFTHGSGNQTRSEQFYRSRAYFFALHGIAALIYDRRGKGASTGGGDDITWLNLAGDAIAGAHALMVRQDINPKQVGIAGFSQGGWVSPLAATLSPDIAFVLVGSAAGVTPDEQNDFNVQEMLRARQVRTTQIDSVMALRKRLSAYLLTAVGNPSKLEEEIGSLRSMPWFKNTLLPASMPAPYDEKLKEYMTFDPAPVWEKVSVPILAIWGEEDAAVPAQRSRLIIENSLHEGGNREGTFKMFPNAGHGVSVIQPRNSPWDWPRLAPGYQELMIAWMTEHVSVVK